MLTILIFCVPALIVRYLILDGPLSKGLSISLSFGYLILLTFIGVVLAKEGILYGDSLPIVYLQTYSAGVSAAASFLILIAKWKPKANHGNIQAIEQNQPQPEQTELGERRERDLIDLAHTKVVEPGVMTREKAERLITLSLLLTMQGSSPNRTETGCNHSCAFPLNILP